LSRIRGAHPRVFRHPAGSDKRPLKPGLLDQALDVGVELVDLIGLPFEVIAYALRGEVDDAARASFDRIQDRGRGLGGRFAPVVGS